MQFNFNFEAFEKSGKDKAEAINYLKNLNSSIDFDKLESEAKGDNELIYNALKMGNFSFSKPSVEETRQKFLKNKENEALKAEFNASTSWLSDNQKANYNFYDFKKAKEYANSKAGKIEADLKASEKELERKKALYKKQYENADLLDLTADSILQNTGLNYALDVGNKLFKGSALENKDYISTTERANIEKSFLQSARKKVENGAKFEDLESLEKRALSLNNNEVDREKAYLKEKEKQRLIQKGSGYTKDEVKFMEEDLGFFHTLFNDDKESKQEFKDKYFSEGVIKSEVQRAVNTLKQFDESELLKNIFADKKENDELKQKYLSEAYKIAELSGFDDVGLSKENELYFIKKDENGEEQKYRVNTGFLDNFIDTLLNAKFEIGAGIAGAVAGAKKGKTPLAKALNSIAGGAVGSFGGALADAKIADIALNRESDFKRNLDYAIQAGVLSAAGDGVILAAPTLYKKAVKPLAKGTKDFLENKSVLGFTKTIPTQNISAAESIINEVFTPEMKQELKAAQAQFGGGVKSEDLQNPIFSKLEKEFAKKYGKDDEKTAKIAKLAEIFNQNSLKTRQQEMLDLVRSDKDGSTLAYLLEVAKDDVKIQQNLKNMLNITSFNVEKNLKNLNIKESDIKSIMDEFESGNKAAFKEVESQISKLYDDNFKVVLDKGEYEKIKEEFYKNGVNLDEATPFLRDIENNVFNREGVSFTQLNNFRKNLNYYIFNKDKSPNFVNSVKKISENILKKEIDKGIDNIFNEIPSAYKSIKELYSTSLKDYAAMKELNESVKKLGLQDKEKTTDEVVKNLIKFAKGQGEADISNIDRLKNYLGEENNAFLEMQILNRLFKESIVENERAKVRVIDSEGFLKRVKELVGERKVYEKNEPLKDFGTNYGEFYRDGKGAVEKLLKEQSGQVQGAFYREELGDIDLVWGDENFGLKHIIDKHGGEFKDLASELSEIVNKGEVVKRKGRQEAYNIEYKGFKVGINKGFNNKGENKWIVTAFDDNVSFKEKTAKTAPANDFTKETSLSLNSKQSITQPFFKSKEAREFLENLEGAKIPKEISVDEFLSLNDSFTNKENYLKHIEKDPKREKYLNLIEPTLNEPDFAFKKLENGVEKEKFIKKFSDGKDFYYLLATKDDKKTILTAFKTDKINTILKEFNADIIPTFIRQGSKGKAAGTTNESITQPFFKSKEAREFLELIEAFHTLYKNDASIAKAFTQGTAQKLGTSIATSAEGAIKQKVVKGAFDPIFRLLPEGILFGLFSKQIQGGALRYHLKKALSRSLNYDDFKIKLEKELQKSKFNNATLRLIDSFLQNLEDFNKAKEAKLAENEAKRKKELEAQTPVIADETSEGKHLNDIEFLDSKGQIQILSKEAQRKWLKTFGLKSLDEEFTPQFSEEVKEALGDKELKVRLGSLKKIVSQKREAFIPFIKETLEQPEAVLKDSENSFLFVKNLKDDDYFVNVSVDKGEYLVSISNGIKELNNLKNKLENGAEVVYQSPNASSNLQTLLQASRYSTNEIDRTNSSTNSLEPRKNTLPFKENEPLKDFGTNYAEFYHNGKGAVEKLLKEQSGQVQGAFYREELGDIDLVWGEITDKAKNKGYGLAHILDKRKAEFMEQGFKESEAEQKAAEFAKNLNELITKGEVIIKENEAVRIETPEHKIILKSNFNGEQTANKWVVTAYFKKGEKDKSISSLSFTEGDNLPSNSSEIIPQTSLSPRKNTLPKYDEALEVEVIDEPHLLGKESAEEKQKFLSFHTKKLLEYKGGLNALNEPLNAKSELKTRDILDYIKKADLNPKEAVFLIHNAKSEAHILKRQIEKENLAKLNELNERAKEAELERKALKTFEISQNEALILGEHFNFKGKKPLLRELRENEIKHALKSHGDEKSEKARGNIAITRADIEENYPSITQEYDEKFFTDKGVIYVKQVNGHHIAIEEALLGQDKLIFKSLWKTKGNYNKEVLTRNAKTSLYPQNADEAVRTQSISSPKLEQGNPPQSHLSTSESIAQNAEQFERHEKINKLEKEITEKLEQARILRDKIERIELLKNTIAFNKGRLYDEQRDAKIIQEKLKREKDKGERETLLQHLEGRQSGAKNAERSLISNTLELEALLKEGDLQERYKKINDEIEKARNELKYLEKLEAIERVKIDPHQELILNLLQKAKAQRGWLKTFGLKSMDEAYTPNFSEEVKEALKPVLNGEEIRLTRGSFEKLLKRERTEFLPFIKETLESADLIVKDKEGAVIFVKDIGKKSYFTSVAKNANGEWIISTNSYKTLNTLKNRVDDKGEVLFLSKEASNILAEAFTKRAFSNELDEGIIPQNLSPQNAKELKKFEQDLNITPLKEFGTNYAEFYRDGKGAVEKLINEASNFKPSKKEPEFKGQVAGAFYREELGDIDLVWGDENFGLKHIIDKHGGEFKDLANDLNEIMERGNFIKQNEVRSRIEFEDFVVGLSGEFKGEKRGFIITAFKRKSRTLSPKQDFTDKSDDALSNQNKSIAKIKQKIDKEREIWTKEYEAFSKAAKEAEANFALLKQELKNNKIILESLSRQESEERQALYRKYENLMAEALKERTGFDIKDSKQKDYYKKATAIKETREYRGVIGEFRDKMQKELDNEFAKKHRKAQAGTYELIRTLGDKVIKAEQHMFLMQNKAESAERELKTLNKYFIPENHSFKLNETTDIPTRAALVQIKTYNKNDIFNKNKPISQVRKKFKQAREAIEQAVGVKPLKDFGTNYAEFYRDGKGAVEKLINEAKAFKESGAKGEFKGQVSGAFYREELGDIDLVWGDENFGLKHILEQRTKQWGEEKALKFVKEDLEKIVNEGQIYKDENTKIELITPREILVLGKGEDKKFIITAFKDRRSKKRFKEMENSQTLDDVNFTGESEAEQKTDAILSSNQSESIAENRKNQKLKNSSQKLLSLKEKQQFNKIRKYIYENRKYNALEWKKGELNRTLEEIKSYEKDGSEENERFFKSLIKKRDKFQENIEKLEKEKQELIEQVEERIQNLDYIEFDKEIVQIFLKPERMPFLEMLKYAGLGNITKDTRWLLNSIKKSRKNPQRNTPYNERFLKELYKRMDDNPSFEVIMKSYKTPLYNKIEIDDFARKIKDAEQGKTQQYDRDKEIKRILRSIFFKDVDRSDEILMQRAKNSYDKYYQRTQEQGYINDLKKWSEGAKYSNADDTMPFIDKNGFMYNDKGLFDGENASLGQYYQIQAQKYGFEKYINNLMYGRGYYGGDDKEEIKKYFQKNAKHILNDGGWTDENGNLTSSKPKNKEAEHKYFNEQSPNIYQSNPHLGAGLLGGVLNGVEQDENGNISFNPQAFLLGFVGGAAGSKALSRGLKFLDENPAFKEKVKEEIAGALKGGYETLVKQYPLFKTLTPFKSIMQTEQGRKAQAERVLKNLLKNEFLKQDKINETKLNEYAVPLPKPLSKEAFLNQLETKDKRGFSEIKTPIGNVKVNLKHAFHHLNKGNTYKKDRSLYSGAFLDTLTDPLFIVKQEYTLKPKLSANARKKANSELVQLKSDESITKDSYAFFKPYKLKGKFDYLIGYALDMKGHIINTTFIPMNQKDFSRIKKMLDSEVLYFKGRKA